MDKVNRMFKQLEEWRGFPDYQLERRADLFFSLYLPEVLEVALKVEMRPDLVPEFPLKHARSHRSDKVDYLAATADGRSLVFVELKTDCESTRWPQFQYLCRGAKSSREALLEDLRALLKASRAKAKYDALIQATIPLRLIEGGAAGGAGRNAVVLIAPNAKFRFKTEAEALFRSELIEFRVVTFAEFRSVVLKHHDPLSKRFAEFLANWGETPE